MTTNMTVVVCSYNGADRIGACLEALLAQELQTTILVIDDGSTDATAAVAASYGVTIHSLPANAGIAAARQAGLEMATSEIVAFCDDDCRPLPEWTKKLADAWSSVDHSVTAIGGVISVDSPSSFNERYLSISDPAQPLEQALGASPSLWYRIVRQFRRTTTPGDGLRPALSLIGANMSFRRDAALAVGGFNPDLVFGEGEEAQICSALQGAHGSETVLVTPNLVMPHDFKPSLRATVKRSYRAGKGVAARWLRNGGLPALRVMPLIVTAAAIVGFELRGATAALITAAAMTYLLRLNWLVAALRRGWIQGIAFPIAGLVDDVASLVGFVAYAVAAVRVSETRASKKPNDVGWPILTTLWVGVIATAALFAHQLPSGSSALILGPSALLLPGAWLMDLLGVKPKRLAARLSVAVSFSMVALMVVGWISSLTVYVDGQWRPLDNAAQVPLWASLALVMVGTSARRHRDPAADLLRGLNSYGALALIASSSMVLLAALGAARLNTLGSPTLAIVSAVVAIAALVIPIAVGWRKSSRVCYLLMNKAGASGWRGSTRAPFVALLFSSTLALLLGTALRGQRLYGWDIQHEYGVALQTAARGAWLAPTNHDAYSSMLSLTVLPTMLHNLTGISLFDFFRFVTPVLLALVPVSLYVFMLDVPRWIAADFLKVRPGVPLAMVTIFIVSLPAFENELIALSRQCMGSLLMVGAIGLLVERTIPANRAYRAVAVLLVALAFTHYSTAYIVGFCLIIAAVVAEVFRRRTAARDSLGLVKARENRRGRMTTWALALVVNAAAVVWNVVYTRNNSLAAPSVGVSTKGLSLKANTIAGSMTPLKYQKFVYFQIHQEKWFHPDALKHMMKLVPAAAPTVHGVFPGLASVADRYNFSVHEGLLILTVLGAALLAWRALRSPNFFNVDLLGLASGAILFGAALRFSGTLSVFFNPPRAEFLAALITTIPVTLLVGRLANRVPGLILAATLLVSGSVMFFGTGLSVLEFGGNGATALSAQGANNDQFITTSQGYAAAVWLQQNTTSQSFVESDRYGQLVLGEAPALYSLDPNIVPGGIDYKSFIYVSQTNILGRASGGVLGLVTTYQFPLAYLDANFYTVFSTGATRVYR